MKSYEEQYDDIGKKIRRRLKASSFNNIKIFDEEIEDVETEYIDVLAGEYSKNRTRSRFGVKNADIGIPIKYKDKLLILFGDTKIDNKDGTDYLVSNTFSVSHNFAYEDGLVIDDYLVDKDKLKVRAIIEGEHSPNLDTNFENGLELTKIPNGAVSIGDNLYMTFMSVSSFMYQGNPDNWKCNYGGMVKSSNGYDFSQLDFKTDKYSNFIQNFMVKDKEYIYMFGIGAGRYTPCRLMRNKIENIEDLDSYEYLQGYKEGEAIWGSKDEGFNLINDEVWEHCIVFNKYLNKWMFSFTNFFGTKIYFADKIYGPYNLGVTIGKPEEVKDLGWYCCYTCPELMKDDGREVWFLISFMGVGEVFLEKENINKTVNIWNVNQIKVNFSKKNKEE